MIQDEVAPVREYRTGGVFRNVFGMQVKIRRRIIRAKSSLIVAERHTCETVGLDSERSVVCGADEAGTRRAVAAHRPIGLRTRRNTYHNQCDKQKE